VRVVSSCRIEGQGASTAREATLQLRVMLILQPTLEPYMDVAALKVWLTFNGNWLMRNRL
jgi:hypothetical protein